MYYIANIIKNVFNKYINKMIILKTCRRYILRI